MKPFPPLVFFGSDDFSASMLARLFEHGFFRRNLQYVVTKTPQKKGRGRALSPTAVHELAITLPNATLLQANTKKELDGVIGALDGPLGGVLVSYGVIVSPFVLNKFKPGIINFHPSLLPIYRGPSPVESAILHGDQMSGVTIMKLAVAMDAGPVYAQHEIPLDGTETPAVLYQRIIDDTADWFATQLQRILLGDLAPIEQDDSIATYTHIIKKEDGVLRPDQQTAAECERQIRAYQPFPKSRLTIDNVDLIISKAHVATHSESLLSVLCADGAYLVIDELTAPGGKTMTADAYLRGKRT